uniref:Uncharacterized protein n=1 Tax=Schistosoma haematobium TaxID=6185 RepID=A0A094ZVJ9_SCHHA
MRREELAYQKMQIVELTHRLDYARHQIEARDQLIVEHGLVLIGGTNVDDNPTSNMEELTATNAHMSSTNKGKFTSNDSNLVMMNGLYNNNNNNNNNNHSKSNSLIHQNGDKSSNHLPEMVLITKSTAELLNTLSETTLDKQIQQLFSMRSELDARVEELESQLREERKRFEAPTTRYDSKNRTNIANAEDIKHELQRPTVLSMLN